MSPSRKQRWQSRVHLASPFRLSALEFSRYHLCGRGIASQRCSFGSDLLMTYDAISLRRSMLARAICDIGNSWVIEFGSALEDSGGVCNNASRSVHTDPQSEIFSFPTAWDSLGVEASPYIYHAREELAVQVPSSRSELELTTVTRFMGANPQHVAHCCGPPAHGSCSQWDLLVAKQSLSLHMSHIVRR
jgi:hypothetical protein